MHETPAPRRRSFTRRARVPAFITAILAPGWYAYQISSREPGHSIDYAQRLVDHVSSHVPAGEDAWPTYLALLEAHTRLQEDIRSAAPDLHSDKYSPHPAYWAIGLHPPTPRGPTGDAQTDELNAQTDKQEAADLIVAQEWARTAIQKMPDYAIDTHLDRLVLAKRMVRPKASELLMLRLEQDLGAARATLRGLRARMRLRGGAGDEPGFVADLERALALGRLIGWQGEPIEGLVGHAAFATALGEVRQLLLSSRVRADTCRSMLQAIDRQAVLPPLSYHFEAERIEILDYLQTIHSDDGHGDGVRLVARARQIEDEVAGREPQPVSGLARLSGMLYPSKAKMVNAANELFDGLVKAADTPRRANRSSVFDYQKFASGLGPGYEMFGVFGGSLDRIYDAQDRLMMTLAGTRLMLAIELYRAEHAELPKTLADLVPGFLPALPDDPFAPDKQFGYLVLSKPDRAGRTYLLYSVGADGTDNHGSAARFPDDALNPAVGNGADFIINTTEEINEAERTSMP